jgi:hypothetical protein
LVPFVGHGRFATAFREIVSARKLIARAGDKANHTKNQALFANYQGATPSPLSIVCIVNIEHQGGAAA